MKVIWFNGNIGNQVFYCKYKEYLQNKYPNEKVVYYSNSKCPKICVDKYFELSLPEKVDNANIRFIFEVLGKIFRRIPVVLVPRWYCTRKVLNSEATYFEHYLQDKSFYESDNSSWLKVKKPNSFSIEYLNFEKLINETKSIAVHIRRGDYITPESDYEDLSATDYYNNAIKEALAIYPDANIFFFSDDIEYVKSKYKGKNIYYIDCNRGENSYLDILLMSQANVNIIANSTFSYWGAYMGHENKIIMYSDLWFTKESGRRIPNIMLDSWRCIISKRY